MMLVQNRWSENLLNVQYGDGYDIRIHASQVALSMLSRRSLSVGVNMDNINFSTVRFGYYDTYTEDAITSFQKAAKLNVTKTIDKVTYESLFNALRGELNVAILEMAPNQLRVTEITKEISDMLPDFEYPYNDEGNDNGLGNNQDEDSSNDNIYNDLDGIYWDDIYGENYGQADFLPPNTEFSDRFWDSIRDNSDDAFAIYTPDFGGSNSGTYRPGGSGEDYTDINGSPSGGGSNNDFIEGLLANSIYKGNFDYDRPLTWASKGSSDIHINVNGYSYEGSDKYGTFFNSKNSSETRKSNYDITILYGANGQFAKKIVGIRPRSKSQQIDSSGEAIYDVIEFIAQDVVETNNRKQ